QSLVYRLRLARRMSVRSGDTPIMRSIELPAVRILEAVAAVVLIGGGAACSNFEPVATHEQISDPTPVYMRLTLDHGAVNLSPAPSYNTVQLTATPRNTLGDPMAGLPAPTFSSSDTTIVRVTPEGLVTAVQPGADVAVIAELTIPGPIRHADTVMINVTDE